MHRLTRLSSLANRMDDQQNPILAVQVNTITWFLVIVFILRVFAQILWPAEMEDAWPAAVLIGLLVWIAIIFALSITRHLQLAAIVLNAGLWGLVNYRAWMAGGIDTPIFLANILILFSAGLLLGYKAALFSVITTIIWTMFLFWSKLAGIIPHPLLNESPFSLLFSNLAFLGTGGVILFITLYHFQQYFQRSQAKSSHYRLLFDESSNGIVIFDSQYHIILANAAACQLLGYAHNELIGKFGLDLVEKEEHLRLRSAIEEKTLPENFPLRGEITIFRKDGSRITALGSFRPLSDGEYQFIFTDISERKRMETRLREQEEVRRLIFENNPYQITLNEYDTSIFQDANQAFCDFYGYSKGEVIGRTPNEINLLVEPWTQKIAGENLVKKGRLQEEEVLTRNKKGEIFTMALSTQTITIADKLYTLTSWTNITRRKKAEMALRETLELTLEGWARAIEMRDDDTGEHGRRVVELTERLADRLKVSEEDHMHLRHGAILHDIGKLGVPDHILRKQGGLDPDEWEIIKKHPDNARRFFSGIPYLREASVIPYYHHENWDGSGYPNGLQGEEIPFAARIFKLADEWDAITNDRPYHKAIGRRAAAAYLQEQSGKRFDPAIVPVFIRLMLETHQLTLEESQNEGIQ